MLQLNHIVKTCKDFTLQIPYLSLEESQTVSIFGEQGSGKTLLIKLILGMCQPEEGAVEVLGNNQKNPSAQANAQLAYIGPDNNYFLESSLRDICRTISPFYPQFDHAYFEKQLKRLNLRETARLGTLRFYEIKIFELVMALARCPRLLILDNPAQFLNYHDHDNFMNLLLEYRKENTPCMLYTTHMPQDLATLGGEYYCLEKGVLGPKQDAQVLCQVCYLVKGPVSLLDEVLKTHSICPIRYDGDRFSTLVTSFEGIRERFATELTFEKATPEQIFRFVNAKEETEDDRA